MHTGKWQPTSQSWTTPAQNGHDLYMLPGDPTTLDTKLGKLCCYCTGVLHPRFGDICQISRGVNTKF
eukprot:1085455-Pelagomonas_calceolata.AAC.1